MRQMSTAADQDEKTATSGPAESLPPRAVQDEALPLWAQLRKAYEFATPKERAEFDALAQAVIERGGAAAQSDCPHGCTEFMHPRR